MKEKEFYTVKETKEFDEIKKFQAQEYYEDKSNPNPKEKYDTFEDSSTNLKRYDYFDYNHERRKKKKESIAKKAVKKILSLPVSIGSGAVALIAGAIIALTIASGLTDIMPNCNVTINEVGFDYVSYDMDIDQLNPNIDYVVQVSNPNQEFNKKARVGLNNYVFTGLNPNETYTISLIGYNNHYASSYTYYQCEFYTLTKGDESVNFEIEEYYNDEELSVGINYNVQILNKTDDDVSYRLMVEGYGNHLDDSEMINNSFTGTLDNLMADSMVQIMVFKNDELLDSYDYEINHSFVNISYEVIYDDENKNAYLVYDVSIPSTKYTYYMYIDGANYYDIDFGEENSTSGRIDNLEDGNYYLMLYAYLKEEFIEEIDIEEEYGDYNSQEKFLYSADFEVTKPDYWEEPQEELDYQFDVSYYFINQNIEIDIQELNGKVTNDDIIYLDITEIDKDGNSEVYEEVLEFDINDDYATSYLVSKFNYSTETINLEIYRLEDNERVDNIYIDSLYKENKLEIDINDSSLYYSETSLEVYYTLESTDGEYDKAFAIYSGMDKIEITDDGEKLIIDNIFDYEELSIGVTVSGAFRDGYHNYDEEILYNILVPRIELDVDIDYVLSDGDPYYKLSYEFITNDYDHVSINDMIMYINFSDSEEELSLNSIELNYQYEEIIEYGEYSDTITINCNGSYSITYGNEVTLDTEFNEFSKSIDQNMELIKYSFNSVDYDPMMLLEFSQVGPAYAIINYNEEEYTVEDNSYELSVNLEDDSILTISYYNSSDELLRSEEITINAYVTPNYGIGEAMSLITYNDDSTINVYMKILDYEYTDLTVQILYEDKNGDTVDISFDEGFVYYEDFIDDNFAIKLKLLDIKDNIEYNLYEGYLYEYFKDSIYEEILPSLTLYATGGKDLRIETYYDIDTDFVLTVDGTNYNLELQYIDNVYMCDCANIDINSDSTCTMTVNVTSDSYLYEEYSNYHTLKGNTYKEYTLNVTVDVQN